MEFDPKLKAVLAKLQQIRERKDLKLRKTPYLRDTIVTLDGSEVPLQLRYYQVQMVLHLVSMPRFVCGDDTGLGKCTRKGTFIRTNRGMVPIEALQPGDMEPDTFQPVHGWRVALGGGAMAPVRNFYYGGTKPTRKARTRYGFEIEGSLVHPMLARRAGGEKFVKLPDLEVGDYLCVDRNTTVFPDQEPQLEHPPMREFGSSAREHALPTAMTPMLARLLGYIVGEAWANGDGKIVISQSSSINPETHADIYSLCEGFWPGLARTQKNDFTLNSVQIRSFFEAMGVDKVVAAGKRVPDPIFRATRESCREFLRGLFEGEGGAVSTGGIEFATASERLGREVQLLLLRFGIVAKRSPKRVAGHDHTYWRLTLFGNDAVLFAERIGFVSERKRQRLLEVLPKTRNANHDVIPYSKALFDQVREDLKRATSASGPNGLRKGSGLKQFGAWLVCGLNNIRNFGRNPTYDFVEKVVDVLRAHAPDSVALPELERLLSTRYFYDPIVSFEDGTAEVMDIEVDDPRHSFVGNGMVNHNTLESIASLCCVWDKAPNTKAIVLTKKSAVNQWAGEFDKFTQDVHVVVCKGSPKQRAAAREEFLNYEGPVVLVMNYRAAVNDFRHIQDWHGFVLISDEAHMFKNPSSQVHQVCKHLGEQASRVWALTATVIKNNLIEGYGVYRVVVPGLFGMSKSRFIMMFAVTKMQPIKGGRKVPVVVGHSKDHIRAFKERIDPFFLGRPKHEVADELPVLTTKVVNVGMTTFQWLKYNEALSGLLELGNGEERETTPLTAITYCQEIVNHPCLIDCDGEESEKLNKLAELLGPDGELEGEKVIVFTRFARMVGPAIELLEKKGIKCVRVTGAESEDEREEAKQQFQDPKSDVKVVWITMAGGDSINLQAAKALVFFDTPWSAGDYIQILGRMIRIGSIHDRVYAIHLVCKQTVDERVMQVVRKKLKLVESIIGKRILGGDEGDEVAIEVESDINAIFNALLDDARSKKGTR